MTARSSDKAFVSGLVLPEDSKILRDLPRGPGTETEDFRAAYDRRTLFYDVFHDAERGLVRIVAPAFKRRMAVFLRGATFKIDGRPCPHRVYHVSPRTGMVDIECPLEEPRQLRLFHKAMPPFKPIRIARTDLEEFAGKNAIVTVSKNNDLEWIRDWLHFYTTQHGANAVVLFDNGSDAYRFRDVKRAVASVPGVEKYAVISAPYIFGPRGHNRNTINSKFFHLSMLHVAHLRFLDRARAVLSVDIDELVTKPGGLSVFDAVHETPQKFLNITGGWRYAMKPDDDRRIRHIDHRYKRAGGDFPMPPKWCVDPQGPLKDQYWRVHGVAGGARNHTHGFRYLHCRQLSTGWDYERGFEPPENFELAPQDEAEMLDAAFGG